MAKKRKNIEKGRLLSQKSGRCDVCAFCNELMSLHRRVSQEGHFVKECSCMVLTCFACAERYAMRHTLQLDASLSGDGAAQSTCSSVSPKLKCLFCPGSITALERRGCSGKVLESEPVPFEGMSASDKRRARRRLCLELEVSSNTLLDRRTVSIADEEADYRARVYAALRTAGAVTELESREAVWRLAHLVAAGDRGLVSPSLWSSPVCTRPVLGGSRTTINPAHAFTECVSSGADGSQRPARRLHVHQRFDPSAPYVPEPAPAGAAAVRIGTRGLREGGFRAVETCCSWPNAADRAEAISYVMCRLVAEGAAVRSMRGRKLQSEVAPWDHGPWEGEHTAVAGDDD